MWVRFNGTGCSGGARRCLGRAREVLVNLDLLGICSESVRELLGRCSGGARLLRGDREVLQMCSGGVPDLFGRCS